MIIQNKPDSPNSNSTYYTTPTTAATSTFAPGSPMMPPGACFNDSPLSSFSFDLESAGDRRKSSMGTFTPQMPNHIFSAQDDPFTELVFGKETLEKTSEEMHATSSEHLSSSTEDAPSNKGDELVDLEEYLKSDPFEKTMAEQEINSEFTFENENPEKWFFDLPPPPSKKEMSQSSPQKKFLQFHNTGTNSNSRLRKTKSFSYTSASKKTSSAGPATPLQNYVGEFHVNEGIFPIQDETATFSKQLSYSSVHKKHPSSKSAMLRRSKTATNLCINTSPRHNREHNRSMEAGLVSFKLQLNNDSKS